VYIGRLIFRILQSIGYTHIDHCVAKYRSKRVLSLDIIYGIIEVLDPFIDLLLK